MFSSFLDSNNKLLVNRLARAQAEILGLSLSTKEEYLAQVTSLINRVINQGYDMQPLITIGAETPGVVGDPVSNLLTLNQDAMDIAAEIDRLEDNASVLFNLSAASRNSICQRIREAIYTSTSKRYIEEFINRNQVDSSSSATLDMNAGVAQLPLTAETKIQASYSVGQNAIGATSSNINILAAEATAETLFTWNGTFLEIIVSFDTPAIVNRMLISPDAYKGYEITTFTASPDGSLFEDILRDLSTSGIVLDAASGKFSGSTVVDFPPRLVSKMRLVIENPVSGEAIGLRSLAFTQRSYQSTGSIVSLPQITPTGPVQFKVDQKVYSPYVSVTHQISADSVHYTTIQPGLVDLPAQWWYRALLSRTSKAFSSGTGVTATTADPAYSTGFTLVRSTSIPLSPTTIERTLVLANVTAPIPLAESPLPGTLLASQGSLYLDKSQYSLDQSNNLTFSGVMAEVTITYQTSSQSSQNVSSLQNYYTPLLTSVHFEK